MSANQPLKILITGGARGIGRGLARILASKGHKLHLLDNNIPELTHTTRTLTSQHPDHISSTPLDLGNPSEITSLPQLLPADFQHLDVLINNAAYTGGVGGPNISSLPLSEWTQSLQTNLTAPMLMVQTCLPLLKNSPTPTIINISSTRAHQSEPNSEAYAATKAGLLGLTQALSVSLAPHNITVNALVLGWIHVGNENMKADEEGTKWGDGLEERDHRWQLTGRVGDVGDVGRAVEYLIGARGVTGMEMVVDGGVTRKMVYPE